jgi:thiol-disulfide isomerase/thioredoxin
MDRLAARHDQARRTTETGRARTSIPAKGGKAMSGRIRLAAAVVLVAGLVRADDKSAAPQVAASKSGVSAIVVEHDKTLIKALTDYLAKNPNSDDFDQAYVIVFEKAIEHDWFLENEAMALGYMRGHPEGPVRPLALVVATMARASDGKFDAALALYKTLLKELDKADQREFGSNLGESLARSATASSEIEVARKVYEAILEKFDESPDLRNTIQDSLDRLAMVGKPAPAIVAKDLQGKTFRLSDLKGKYVLLDFWATFCGPCLKELPNLKAVYGKYHEKGLEIVSISLDEKLEPVRDFVKENKIPWREIHNNTAGADVVESFRVNNIPVTFLIAPDGRVARLDLTGEGLDKALAQLLK